ncbi:MAG: dihydroorotate dehydrogenase electron transfer subunit [Clostridiales bacterium]|nr:dihydroorotate dehydrogenase electron transfer subunit [Clostridiales bacterium]
MEGLNARAPRDFAVAENRSIARDVYRMRLAGPAHFTAPGQFAAIAIPGFFLRRPFSALDYDDAGFEIAYKVVGGGTAAMCELAIGARLSAMTGLGNGFDASVDCAAPLLVGGGVGAPPLFGLAKALIARGLRPNVALGFRTAEDAMLVEDFEALGLTVALATEDGTAGARGYVTGSLPAHDYFFACGPEPMLAAVARSSGADGQLSFEQRMACGIGACMGCSCQTMFGYKRVCRDGPVLGKGEVRWPS